ncbi:MAG: hypothetical protein WDN69_02330 [Aliidongia sp.]
MAVATAVFAGCREALARLRRITALDGIEQCLSCRDQGRRIAGDSAGCVQISGFAPLLPGKASSPVPEGNSVGSVLAVATMAFAAASAAG